MCSYRLCVCFFKLAINGNSLQKCSKASDSVLVSEIAVFVLIRNGKLQPTNVTQYDIMESVATSS